MLTRNGGHGIGQFYPQLWAGSFSITTGCLSVAEKRFGGVKKDFCLHLAQTQPTSSYPKLCYVIH